MVLLRIEPDLESFVKIWQRTRIETHHWVPRQVKSLRHCCGVGMSAKRLGRPRDIVGRPCQGCRDHWEQVRLLFRWCWPLRCSAVLWELVFDRGQSRDLPRHGASVGNRECEGRHLTEHPKRCCNCRSTTTARSPGARRDNVMHKLAARL